MCCQCVLSSSPHGVSETYTCEVGRDDVFPYLVALEDTLHSHLSSHKNLALLSKSPAMHQPPPLALPYLGVFAVEFPGPPQCSGCAPIRALPLDSSCDDKQMT